MPRITPLSFFPLLLLALLALTAGADAQPLAVPVTARQSRVVELKPPATFELVPLADGPLLRGHPMQFSLRYSGTPKPINMWSVRVDCTTDTLTFVRLVPAGRPGNPVVISDPYVATPGLESRSMAGLSLDGIPAGELARLEFQVRPDAPAHGSLLLADHPKVREGLAHDDPASGVTELYTRTFLLDRTRKMPVQDSTEKQPPYVFPTPKERTPTGGRPPRTDTH